MQYVSTRGKAPKLNFCDVLLEGLAEDGGLYVPERYPSLSFDEIKELSGCSYSDLALKIIKLFTQDSLPYAELEDSAKKALATFRHQAITPLVQVDDNEWIMELFHGKTLAFKDHALSLLGELFDKVLSARGEKITIVGATSGDTGSAAISACSGRKAIDIFILHPEGRVSEVQRRQMTTVDADNVFNIAIDGTFDDCQNLVKQLFANQEFKEESNLSAVNSINWARIMAQIVYYFRAGTALCSPFKKIDFAVPTGNFGNVFAGYAASLMGLPVGKFIVASNVNDILYRFFETAVMKKTEVKKSLSPSMDIQVSSNFERLLFEICQRDGSRVSELMNNFKTEHSFAVTEEEFAKVKNIFVGASLNDNETIDTIKKTYHNTGMILDPHTAVALGAAAKIERDKKTPLVILSTAHPAKFSDAIEKAIGKKPEMPEFISDVLNKKEYYYKLPNDLNQLISFIKARARILKGTL